MKQSIARAFRRVADKLDPAGERPSVTNITVNNHSCANTDQPVLRSPLERERMYAEAFGLDKLAPGAEQAAQTGREMSARLLQYIADGLVRADSHPTPPNAAGEPWHPWGESEEQQPPWWRRLLRRFGR